MTNKVLRCQSCRNIYNLSLSEQNGEILTLCRECIEEFNGGPRQQPKDFSNLKAKTEDLPVAFVKFLKKKKYWNGAPSRKAFRQNLFDGEYWDIDRVLKTGGYDV